MIYIGSAWVMKGEGWTRASKPQGSEMWMIGLNLTWRENIARHCSHMNLIKSSFLLHSYQHLPAIRCPQHRSFKWEVFLEHAWENINNSKKVRRRHYLPRWAKFRKRQRGEPSGSACTNSAHIHDVQAKRRTASIIHLAAMWNAVEGPGMVSGRFVHRSEVEPHLLLLFLKVLHEFK